MKSTKNGITRIALVAVLCIQASTLTGQAPVRAADWAPAPKPSDWTPAFLPICTTASQLDCLESVGAYINGVLVTGTATGRVETNSFNNSVIPEWRIPGLVNEDGRDLVQTQLRSRQLPGGQIGMSLEMYVSSQDGYRPRWESPRTDCQYKNQQGECFRFGNPQTGVKYVATFRSSWILPNIVSGSLENADAEIEKLNQSGASRITVAGIPMTYQLRDNALAGQKDEAGLALLKWFRFDISDGRFLPRAWRCLESEPPLIFGNGVGGGSAPTFTDGLLDFQVSSPHFEPDGSKLFIGAYNATIPLATAECMWGTKITSSSQLAVKVFESETNAAQSTTSAITIADSFVKIVSTGFTYSNKTVRVAPTVAKPTNVKTSPGRGTIRVTFKRVTGLTYTVTAAKGSSKKTLKCSRTAALMTCNVSRIAKGTWKISIVAKKGSTPSAPVVVNARVR
jgi:hypothetical protein